MIAGAETGAHSMAEPWALNPDGLVRPRRRFAMLTVIALAVSLGICAGDALPALGFWWWTGAALLGSMGALILRRRTGPATAMLVISAMGVGAAWLVVRQHHLPADDVAAHLGDRSVLVRARGEAITPPEVRRRAAGSMAEFDYRPPATHFRMRLEALLDRDGAATPARGEVMVRVDEVMPPFNAGDRVDVIGFLLRPGGPQNPGELDYRRLAADRGQAGMLRAGSREAVAVTPAAAGSLRAWLRRTHGDLRQRAAGWLLAHLPDTPRTEREALLADLLLGVRDHELDEVREAFRRLGLAHVLAISGFHLTVLAGFSMLLLRLGGRSRRWHGLVVIAVVAFYLLIVEPRTPVLRAGVMTIAACAGAALGRRLHVGGLVALSGALLLLRHPLELFTPGFQLSFGVVLALIHFTQPVRERWFGRPDQEAATTVEMLVEWLRTGAAAAVVAWAAATPIVAYHFGAVSPLAAVLSLVTLPIVSVLLAAGYTKMLFSLLLPSGALFLGAGVAVLADVLTSIVLAADRMPGSIVHVPFPSAWWVWAALAWVTLWALRESGRHRMLIWSAGAAVALWLVMPLLPLPHARAALRIDMLAVGDGSCYLLRSGRRAAIFDAGSSTDLNAGRRVVIPALRRLGVRSIDFIAISHANLDHYSAVLELVEEFRVGEVLLTPQFIARAAENPGGAPAFVLEDLRRREVPIHAVAAGESRQLGETTLEWIHPAGPVRLGRVNDESMVIRFRAAERRGLLCGDAQRQGLGAIMGRGVDLDVEVIELPHHGSHSDVAAAFVRRASPWVVMQSTGWGRWRNDRWAMELGAVERLVTARDGACWVEIGADGAITVGRGRLDREQVDRPGDGRTIADAAR
jgi:competence protein ComEC